MRDVDLIRSKIRLLQRNQVILEVPKRYLYLFSQIEKSVSLKITQQDVTMFNEMEVQLCHNVAEVRCFI